MKKTISGILLVMFMMSFALGNAVAANSTSEGTSDSTISEIRAIAVHAPSRFEPTSDWLSEDVLITKETPLYDINDTLCAYCLDLKNRITDETAYILISTGGNDFPIIGYAPQGISPYFEIPATETAVFLSIGNYYIDDGDVYTSVIDGTELQKSALSVSTAETTTFSQTTEDYSDIRQMYANGTFPNSVSRAGTSSRNLTGVPNWQWTCGCAPTAMGMIISYQYQQYGWTQTEIISGLASYMKTSAGGTSREDIMPGTSNYLASKNSTPTTCEWNSSDSSGCPNLGASYNPKSVYKAQIDAGNPVFVLCDNSTMTSQGFIDGFGTHGMAGVGYMFSTVDGDYIIVHTTATIDEDFYASLDSSTFSEYAWGILEPGYEGVISC